MDDLIYKLPLSGKVIEDALTYVNGLPAILNSINGNIANLESNKAPSSAIPNKVSQLENDSGFINDEDGYNTVKKFC